MLITEIISKVDYIILYGDIFEFEGAEIKANQIWYNDTILHVGGISLKVENGRYAFAQALACFESPKMQQWFNYNAVCENTKFDGTVNMGFYNVLGGPGFGYEKGLHIKHLGDVSIGKNVVLHNHVNIDRSVLGSTVIMEGNKIDSFCHIAHNVQLGQNNTLAAHTIIEGSCTIGNDNIFGTGVIIQKQLRVGNNNIFGSGCVVTKEIGDNGIYVGNPARLLRNI